jgi:hydrogenase-4 component E
VRLLATHTKQLVVISLVIALFFPPAVLAGSSLGALALALGAFLAKTLALAAFLAVVESSYAKLRLFRMPKFLGLGLLCAFLALALRVHMTSAMATTLIDDLGALLLFTMLLIVASGRLYRAIYAVSAQAVFLALAGGVLALATGNVDLWIIRRHHPGHQGVALPALLIHVIQRVQIRRDIEPVIPMTLTLVLAALIVVFAFRLSASLGAVRQTITGNALPVGIALTLLGVLVMASRKKAMTQMVGLFAAENGIFFTAMAVSQGMPLIIEIGVILDVVLGALVMGIFVLRVRSSVDADIADLEDLKG